MSSIRKDVPFSEPYWYFGTLKSPHYNESHVQFRDKVRAFVDKEIMPYVGDWEESGEYPMELHETAYKAGISGFFWPKEYGGDPPAGFDAFHDFIYWDELSRCGAGGLILSCFFTISIALPPVMKWGSPYLKDKVMREVVTAKKIIALAVTEPFAGSDVAGIKTTAKREGDFYIVNGSKKYITAGLKATYFTVAVRTGGAGIPGISLLLIEAGTPGFTVRRLKTQGMWQSNTTHLSFDDVKVPAKNLIGKENQGFRMIMHNFNHERFAGAAMANRNARNCLAEAITYARDRTTFGKRLIDHQAIRHKIAEMARQVESTHALLEQICYQSKLGIAETEIGGRIALLKVQSTKTFEFCAREASQVLGGAACLREGKGSVVERLYREVRISAIGGGSEEILLDLAMRQSKL